MDHEIKEIDAATQELLELWARLNEFQRTAIITFMKAFL